MESETDLKQNIYLFLRKSIKKFNEIVITFLCSLMFFYSLLNVRCNKLLNSYYR